MTFKFSSTMDGTSVAAVAIKRADFISNALLHPGGASAGRLTMSAESASAVYGGAQITPAAESEVSTMYSQASKVVDDAINSWNSMLTTDRNLMDALNRCAENATEKQAKEFVDFAKVGSLGKALATQAVILASKPLDYMKSTESASQMRSRATSDGRAVHATLRGTMSGHLAALANGVMHADHRMSMAAENFTDTATSGLLARYAVVYHAAAQRQETAVEASYPTMLLPIDQLGVHLTSRVVTTIRNAYHQIDGSPFNLYRENILNSLVHPEDFTANQTRAIPMYREGTEPLQVANRTHFVSSDVATKRAVNYDRIPFEGMTVAEKAANTYYTNYLRFGMTHNVIALAQPPQATNGGQRNFTDTLNPAAYLNELVISFVDPTDPTDETKWESYAFNVSEISSAFAIEAADGDTKRMNFVFSTQSLMLCPKNMFKVDTDLAGNVTLSPNTTTGNAATRVEALLAVATNAVPPATNFSADRRIDIGVSVNGHINLQTGELELNANPVKLVGYSSASTVNPVAFADGSAEWADAKALVDTARVTGFECGLMFENLGAREIGTKIDSIDMRHYAEVNIHPPIMAVGSVLNETGIAPDRIQNLQFQAYAAQSGAGIDHLLAHNVKTDLNYRGETRLSMRPTTTLGITSYNVNTFHRGGNVDALEVTSASTNLDVVPNFRELVTNLVIRWAAEGDIESRLQIYREVVYGGQAPQPTICFTCDPILTPYLFTQGDARLLGDRYPFVMNTTYNHKFRGKVAMTWLDPTNNSQGAPNTLNHGNTLSKAEVVLKLPTWRDGATQLELGLSQCYRHIAHMPMSAMLTVSSIDALLTNKVSRNISIVGPVQTI